jgi:hypothetical protein
MRLSPALLALALVGCGSAATSAPATTPSATVASTPSATPASTPEVTGDAATNPACALLSVAEVEQITGRHVRDILGTTSPGSYSGTFLTCSWHVEPTDIQSPGITVQFEVSPHEISGVLAYERGLITQGQATGVPGIGDVALIQGATGLTLDGIVGRDMFHVRVQLHAPDTDTKKQQDLAIATARLILPRLPR